MNKNLIREVVKNADSPEQITKLTKMVNGNSELIAELHSSLVDRRHNNADLIHAFAVAVDSTKKEEK